MVINMSEYKNVPKIRFKGFTDDWEQRKFENIYNYERPDKYIVNSTEYLEFGSTPVLTANKAFILGYTTENNKYVNSKESIIFDDFTMDTKFVDFPYMVKSSAIKILTLKDEKKDNIRFNFELLSNHRFNMLGHARHYISVVQPEEVFTTNKQEQDKIGELFTNLDNLITLHQRKCDALMNVKKSLLEKMFPKNSSNIPEIRFKGFTDVWEQRKLGEIGNTFTGLSGKTKEDFGHGEAKFVTYMNVFSNPIAQLNKTEPIEIDNKQNQVEYGDVFFTTSSETPDEVGMSSVWLENKGNIYLNSFCFGFRPFVKNDPYYMAYMLRANRFRKSMTLLAQGISRYNISKIGVMNIDIQLPNNQEQERIGKLFSEIDNLITLHQRKLEKLNNIKKSMLDKMFV